MSYFNQSRSKGIKRAAFDRSHEVKMSFNMGDLVPFYMDEILPGDKFKVNSEVFMRFAPLVSPVMHRINVYTHFWNVPYRLIWNEWEDFITGGPDGTLAPAFPQFLINEANKLLFLKRKLPDYFGIPPTSSTTTITKALVISALPFRAYQLIYNEFYRDQNLTDPVDFSISSGMFNEESLVTMRKRAYEKDYFTAALPWAQRGEPISIPVDFNYKDISDIVESATGTKAGFDENLKTSDGGYAYTANEGFIRIENLESEGVNVSINDLRTSNALQVWLEKNARGGARYVEQIWHHFKIKSSDARLQRPEFLGGGKNPVQISEVLQTSSSPTDFGIETDTPQGNMAGRGISVGSNNSFTKSFEEHGIVLGIMSVLPRTAYMNGIDRSWTRTAKEDFYFPEFAQLGEQAVLNKELFYDYTEIKSGLADETFGYQERYAEYKYKQSQVAGDFRDSLNHWHLGRSFPSQPVLNESFVMSNDISHRIFAVTDPDVHKLYTQIYNNVKAIRPMPKHAIPSL